MHIFPLVENKKTTNICVLDTTAKCQLFSNYVHIINKYYIFSGLNFNANDLKWNNNVTNEENGNIGDLKDMIDIRDGFKHCDVLDINQVEHILDEMCLL